MIQILCGGNDYSIHEALLDIKSGLGDPENLASNTSSLDGSRLSTAELRANVETFPFFGDKRLVIIQGLLERFESKPKNVPDKQAGADSGLDAFAAILASAPASTLVILLEDEIKKTNPLLKELSGKATIKEYPALGGTRLMDWIKQRFSKSGGSVSEEAAGLLVRNVGANLWSLSSEIDKLTVLAGDRRVETSDIEIAVSSSREAGIFELVDAVMAGHTGPAQRLLQAMLRDGQAPTYIIFMLARQLRFLVRAKSLIAEGMSDNIIASKLGIHEFALRKTMDQAARFNMARLKISYHQLLDADLAIKTGRFDEDVAISLLITEACTG